MGTKRDITSLFSIAGIALLTVVLGSQMGSADTVRGNLCPGWAQSMDAVSDDFRMHERGCDDQGGTWKRIDSECATIAYRAADNGKRGVELRNAVRDAGFVVLEDGTCGRS